METNDKTPTATDEQTRELIAAAGVCASDRSISRRLAAAVAAVYPDLSVDADTARRANQHAQALRVLPFGAAQPAPRTAADRVWARIDQQHGPAITRDALAGR